MPRSRNVLGLLGVAICGLSAGAHAQGAAKKITVEEFIYRVALKSDCYFTIEEANSRGEVSNRIESTWIPSPEEEMPLEDSLRHLLSGVQGARVLRNEKAPCVLHLIDARLTELNGYAISGSLREFKYQGSLGGMVSKITEAFPSFSLASTSGASVILLPDTDSIVRVPLQEVTTVRDVMTGFLPLAGYNRILWKGKTSIKDNALTEVRFLGPSFLGKTPLTAGVGGTFDPGSGQVGLDSYMLTIQHVVPAAIAYVRDKGPKAGRASQLRWDIRLLGALRAEKAIPVLLDLIDYQYSPYGVVTESYPAVYSLTQIGPPAARPAVAWLAKETNATRRELMCAVLVEVVGRDQAGRLVKETLENSKDLTIRRNLEPAMALIVRE